MKKVSFKCKSCGKCCQEFARGYLPLWEFEVYDLLEKAREKGIEIPIGSIKPVDPLFEEVTGVAIFPYYGLFMEPCPFLKGNKCSIYKNRFSICRRFPILIHPEYKNFIKDGLEEKDFMFCDNFNLPAFVNEVNFQPSQEKSFEVFNKGFGKIAEEAKDANKMREFIDEKMKQLIEDKKVVLRRIPEDVVSKCKKMPILYFLRKRGFLSQKELQDLTESN
ncbi:Putative zinc- or iron-chelating domain protein [uncultured archaeon]|nr:Putative zinc- or iron-chelating domain protein [uncultured archaeon]